MKRNVDLTEHMLFSRDNRHPLIDMRYLSKIWGRKIYLWNTFELKEIHDDSELCGSNDRPLIPLGNYRQRQLVKECDEAESADYCDCCGTFLARKPWSRRYGICLKCYNQLELHNKRILPWHRREPMKAERSRIIL